MPEPNTGRKRVVLVDDEPAAIANLRAVIESFAELEIVAAVADGKTAIEVITRLEPDVVFLDIEMPEVDGFAVVAATSHVKYQLVFVTAYDQYAMDAFDTRAIDYLLKPARPRLIEKCIEKILHQETMVLESLGRTVTDKDSVTLSDGNTLRVLKHTDIYYIEGIGRYRRIHLSPSGAQTHRVSSIVSDTTLDEFEAQLPAQRFVRLHRGYIVRIEQISSVTIESRRHFAKLADLEIKVPVSRGRVAALRKLLRSD